MNYLQARAREYLSQTYFGGRTVGTRKEAITGIKYWEPPVELEAKREEKKGGEE